MHFLKDLLTCRLSKQSEDILLRTGFRLSGFFKKTKKMSKFTRKFNWVRKMPIICRQSLNVVIKTIRLPLFLVEELFKLVPRLKVVHLVRDPRATLLSQQRAMHSKKDDDNIQGYCARVYSDVIFARHYQFQNRITRVRFEDISTKPFDVARDLYKFAGMKFGPRSKRAILSTSSANWTRGNNCGAYCTRREDSSLEAYDWRLKIKYDFVKRVDRACGYIYTMLGYRVVNSPVHLRNVTAQLWI